MPCLGRVEDQEIFLRQPRRRDHRTGLARGIDNHPVWPSDATGNARKSRQGEHRRLDLLQQQRLRRIGRAMPHENIACAIVQQLIAIRHLRGIGVIHAQPVPVRHRLQSRQTRRQRIRPRRDGQGVLANFGGLAHDRTIREGYPKSTAAVPAIRTA